MNRNCLAKKITFLLLLSSLLFGCYESKDAVYLNPDGSGKIIFTAHFTPINLNLSGDDKSPEEDMKKAVKDVLEKSIGVEAWQDVSYELADDGRIKLHATAYFKEVSKLNLHNLNIKSKISLKTLPDGNLELLMMGGLIQGDRKALPPKEKVSDIGEAKMAKRIKEEKAKYQKSRKAVAIMLTDLDHEIVYHLPGQVIESTNFVVEDKNRVKIHLTGEKYLAAIDKLTKDENFWRLQVLEKARKKDERKKELQDELSKIFNREMFGAYAPVRAIITETQPLFDYKEEVKKAELKQAEILSALTIALGEKVTEKKRVVEPASKTPGIPQLSNIVIGKVESVPMLEDEQKTSSLLYSQPGYKLTLVATFSAPILSMTEGRIEAAETDTGFNIIKEGAYSRKITYSHLRGNNDVAVFDVALKNPDGKARRLAKLSGTIQYITGSSTRQEDLQFKSLATGEKGKLYGSEIKTIKELSPKEQRLQLHLNMDRHQIKSTLFKDKEGKTIDVMARGSSHGSKSVDLYFNCKCRFPDGGKIIIETYTDIKDYSVPFELNDVDLLGRRESETTSEARPQAVPPQEVIPEKPTIGAKSSIDLEAGRLSHKSIPRPVHLEATEHEDFTVFHLTGELSDTQTYELDVTKDFVWVGTRKGLLRFDKKKRIWSIVGPEEGIPAEMVYEVAADDKRVVVELLAWNEERKSASHKGVYFYDPQEGSWQFVAGSANDLDIQGNDLWLASYPGAIKIDMEDGIQWKYGKGELDLFNKSRMYAVDAIEKNVWLAVGGTHDRELRKFVGGGVAKYDYETDSWQQFTKEDGLIGEYTTGIAADKKEVWASHWNEEDGLSVFDLKSGQWRQLPKSANGFDIGGVRLALDKKHVWIGQQRGLVKLDRKTNEAVLYKEEHGLPGYIVSGVTVAKEGVWVAAYSYGGGGNSVRSSGIVFIPYKTDWQKIGVVVFIAALLVMSMIFFFRRTSR